MASARMIAATLTLCRFWRIVADSVPDPDVRAFAMGERRRLLVQAREMRAILKGF